jgi:hypothetical protein
MHQFLERHMLIVNNLRSEPNACITGAQRKRRAIDETEYLAMPSASECTRYLCLCYIAIYNQLSKKIREVARTFFWWTNTGRWPLK